MKDSSPAPEPKTTELIAKLSSIFNEITTLRNEVESSTKWLPVFSTKSVANVRYADRPLAFDPDIKTIPSAEFAAVHNFTWTDNLLVDLETRQRGWSQRHNDKFRFAVTALEECLQNPLESFIICDVDERVGKGVFLSKDAQPIPRGTIIAIYAGRVLHPALVITSDYFSHYDDIVSKRFWTAYGHTDQLVCDASIHGNFTRFIQDMPSEAELQKAGLPPEQAQVVATANVIRVGIPHYGWPLCIYMVKRDIQPGEQLGVQYIDDINDKNNVYWIEKTRLVFNMNAEVIGQFENATIKLECPNDVKKMPKALRCARDIQDIIDFSSPEMKNGFDYRKCLIANAQSVMEAYACQFPEPAGEHKFIRMLQNITRKYTAPEDAIKLYQDLKTWLEHKAFVKFNDSLGVFKQELFFYMKRFAAKYQEQQKILQDSQSTFSKPLSM